MYASPPRDWQSGRVIRKRKPALPQDVCRVCNRFQYHEDFEEVHARDGCKDQRTEIVGEPDSYVIKIHTQALLRDGDHAEDASRLRNCAYCRLLYDTLNLFFNDASLNWTRDAKSDPTARVKLRFNQGSPLVLACEDAIRHYSEFTLIRGDVEIFSADWGKMTTSDFPTARLAPPTPTPAEAWTREKQNTEGFLQYWFRGCAGRADATDQCYTTPNRLLEVDLEHKTIKLCEFRSRVPGMPDLETPVDYATLSHCWLDDDPKLPKLLTSNIREWRQGFKIACLPAAIRDAVKVATLNFVYYLFIDSLCIMQDNQQDLDAQRPMVGYYFRDSILTIVAASSASPDDGFLHPPERDWLTKTVDFRAPSGASATLTMRKKYSRPVSPSDAVDEASTLSQVALGSFRRTGPLYARHWCLQEALLGTRVMHFTSSGIMFDCKRHDCTREAIKCNLCSGRHVGNGHHRSITMPYSVQKAPSFSWASVDAPVIFRHNADWDFMAEARVIGGGSLPQRADEPCGNVDGAWIQLEACIKKCEVSQTLRGATGGHWQFVYLRNSDGTTTKKYPFVGDGSLVAVKGKQAALERLRKRRASRAQRRSRKKRHSGSKSKSKSKSKSGEAAEDDDDDNPNRSHTYLTRNHYESRRGMEACGTITGVAWVMLVRRRGLWYPGAFERIGCIRDVPASLLDSPTDRQVITLV
ncbi:hypothetical protein TgHK011_004523 [Trichoderma gracile]|nr:hypothetical protein TgHK011_004523 [Trichoderma gracile]